MLAYIQYSNNKSPNVICTFPPEIIYHKIYSDLLFLLIFSQWITGVMKFTPSLHLCSHIYVHMARHTHTNENTVIQAHRDLERSVLCKPPSVLAQVTPANVWMFHRNKDTPTHTCSTQTHMLNNRDASQHTLSYH